MKKYSELLNISIDGGKMPLYISEFSPISNGYQRVVIGQRGPYVEFTKHQIMDTKLYIPKNQLYRLSDPKVYYIEFRTVENNVKVYYQMRNVAYADYLINHFYISPNDLYLADGNTCIKKTEDFSVDLTEFFEFNN